MHIVVSGWFWGQTNTGSGQYLHRLLPSLLELTASNRAEVWPGGEETSETGGLGEISSTAGREGKNAPGRGSDRERLPRFTLLLPRTPMVEEGHSILSNTQEQLNTVVAAPPQLPRQLAKLYWEQVTVPLWTRRIGADLLLVPYWAAPLWQPAPTAVTVHDLIPLLLPAYRGGWLGSLYTRLVRVSTRRCAAVLTVSEAGRRDIVTRLKLPAEQVFAIHHGPNEMTLPTEGPAGSAGQSRQAGSSGNGRDDAIGKKYGLPERYFLYLGGFDVRKNVQGIVRAYRRYLEMGGDAGVQLVIAGTLPRRDTDFFPDPQRLAVQLEIAGQVKFTGWVDEADKAALYAGATAFLFPSAYEGFGMMVLEAMAAGTPVITSSE